jgi:hypothetical protein
MLSTRQKFDQFLMAWHVLKVFEFRPILTGYLWLVHIFNYQGKYSGIDSAGEAQGLEENKHSFSF